tara:strand:+ start:2329 stop:2799 length:471 start_codon:yes stop_codon:yes gene_type:complete
MELPLNRIEPINSNKKEKLHSKKTNFITNEMNLDTIQSMVIKEKYQNLTNNTNYQFMTNSFKSINDNIDFVECINNRCTKIDNKSIINKEKDLVKNKNKNGYNIIMNNLDILVSLVYIFLLVIFLFGSVIQRDSNKLIYILIITLFYLFYKIFISY